MVVLLRALPEHGLQAGDIGAVVQCYSDGRGLEVEFVSGSGETVAVATLERSEVRLRKEGEILHVREPAAEPRFTGGKERFGVFSGVVPRSGSAYSDV